MSRRLPLHTYTQVDVAAAAAVEAGHPVQVLRRDNRQGYKAGAMVEGLNRVEGQGFEYVVIFDADFEPPKASLLACACAGHKQSRRYDHIIFRFAC